MAEHNSVAMFVQGDDGRRVQVGWASPKDETGIRTIEYSAGFEGTSPKDVSFEDDEITQIVAEDQHEARLGDGSDGSEFQIEEHPTNDDTVELPRVPFNAAPVYETVAETDAQDAAPIDDAPDESKDAEPVEETGEHEEQTEVEPEAPQTRRELRNTEDND